MNKPGKLGFSFSKFSVGGKTLVEKSEKEEGIYIIMSNRILT